MVLEGKYRAAVGTREEWRKSPPQALLCSQVFKVLLSYENLYRI